MIDPEPGAHAEMLGYVSREVGDPRESNPYAALAGRTALELSVVGDLAAAWSSGWNRAHVVLNKQNGVMVNPSDIGPPKSTPNTPSSARLLDLQREIRILEQRIAIFGVRGSETAYVASLIEDLRALKAEAEQLTAQP